jgi:hypothetical protein
VTLPRRRFGERGLDLIFAWTFHPAGPLLFAAMAGFVAAALRGTRPLTGRLGFGRAVEAMTLGALALGLGRALALS